MSYVLTIIRNRLPPTEEGNHPTFKEDITTSTFLANYFTARNNKVIIFNGELLEKLSVVFMPKILDMERGGHPLLPLPNLQQLTAPLGAPTPLGHGRYIKSATYFQKKFM